MKKLLYSLLIHIFTSCANQGPVNTDNRNLNQLDTLISGNKLFIKDKTLYSQSFITGLVELARIQTSCTLIEDSLVVNSMVNTSPDSIINKPFTYKYTIPTNLDLNKEVRFSTKLSDSDYNLILKRTNFTNIEYHLKKDSKTIKSGTAILNASFFFGFETQEDENGHIMYLNQYIDENEFDSYLKIEIDRAERATFSYCIDEKTGKYEILPMFFRE